MTRAERIDPVAAVGIAVDIIDDLKMEVWPRGCSRRTDGADHLPSSNALAGSKIGIAQMRIEGDRAVIMLDLYVVAEAGLVSRVGLSFVRIVAHLDRSASDGENWRTGCGCEIQTIMEGMDASDRVNARTVERREVGVSLNR